MTSELPQQQNDAITYFTCNCISRHWKLSTGTFSAIAALVFVKFKGAFDWEIRI